MPIASVAQWPRSEREVAMRAVVFREWQTFPSLETVEQPEPGAGEVLLKVAGAGACHSDVAIYKGFAKGGVWVLAVMAAWPTT